MRWPVRADFAAQCSASSLRCDDNPASRRFRYSARGEDTPTCCARHLIETLFSFCALLDAHDIRHFILWGTHLGALRHSGMIPWDTDHDIGIFAADRERVVALVAHLERRGHRAQWGEHGDKLTVDFSERNTLHLDVSVWWLDISHDADPSGNVDRSWRWQEYRIAETDLLPLRRLRFHDRELVAPRGFEYGFDYYGRDCLEVAYRQWLDWDTPLWRGTSSQRERFPLHDRRPASLDESAPAADEPSLADLLKGTARLIANVAGVWRIAWWFETIRDGQAGVAVTSVLERLAARFGGT